MSAAASRGRISRGRRVEHKCLVSADLEVAIRTDGEGDSRCGCGRIRADLLIQVGHDVGDCHAGAGLGGESGGRGLSGGVERGYREHRDRYKTGIHAAQINGRACHTGASKAQSRAIHCAGAAERSIVTFALLTAEPSLRRRCTHPGSC